MSAVLVSVLCVGAAIVCTCLKRKWPEMALVTALAAGICIIAASITDASGIIMGLKKVAETCSADGEMIKLMLRACGISLVAEFASQLCKDAGESALSGRIVLCSKITVAAMAAPSISDILLRLSSLLSL